MFPLVTPLLLSVRAPTSFGLVKHLAFVERFYLLGLHRPDPARAATPHRRGSGSSMRWVLVHMIEEAGRHAGHADILREQIDGSAGR